MLTCELKKFAGSNSYVSIQIFLKFSNVSAIYQTHQLAIMYLNMKHLMV